MERMLNTKIIFFHPSNNYTGSTRVLANIIAEDFNGKASVLTNDIDGGGFLSDMQLDLYIPKYPLFKGKKFFLSGIINRINAFLLTLKLARSYDIFYINTIIPFYAAIIGVLLNKKIIYHVHEKAVAKSGITIISEFVFSHVKAERIYVSHYVANCYNNRGYNFKIRYNRLSEKFIKKSINRPVLERSLNTVTLIAAPQIFKGVFNFIKLAESNSNINFILVLSADKERIHEFLGEVELPNLKILPSQRDIHEVLMHTDIIVNMSIPSLFIETFGMTILEAMPYGIPSIVPKVGGITEIVDNGYNGYHCDVENIKEMSERILEMLRSEVYSHLSDNSYKKYLKLNS